MKMALVCDDLIQFGGHENVVMEMCKTFPEAHLFTTVASKKWQKKCAELNIKLHTSFVARLPFIERLNRHYAIFLAHILALEEFDFTGFDLVISLSSRFAHGVITKPKTTHISYLSTVGRMFWEPNSYFEKENFGVLKRLATLFLAVPVSYIRLWDKVAASRPDHFLANSTTTANRIAKYYNRTSTIIYPSLDVKKFKHAEAQDYYLVVTRLVAWKRVEIAIEACLQLGIKLKIIGTGPHEKTLQKLASGNSNIEFLGYVTEEQKIDYLANCKALINTQFEDFGIVPLEAMASGKPVIAFKRGGALETVIPGITGEFFEEQNYEYLKNVLLSFDAKKYNSIDCVKQASKFDKKIFREKVRGFVNSVY